MPPKKTKKSSRTVEERYQKKSQREHILLRPDSYVGSVSLQEEKMWIYDKTLDKIVEKFSHMIKNNGQIPEHLKTKKFAQRVLPKKWGEKGPTITVTSLPDDFVHYSQARSLTVREWARLQSFPDWYEFAGKRTTGGVRRAGNPRASIFEREVPKYTQIGNAVPPLLGKAVGKAIVKTYKEKRKAELLSKYSVDELIEVVRAHAFDYKKIESERKIQNANRN